MTTHTTTSGLQIDPNSSYQGLPHRGSGFREAAEKLNAEIVGALVAKKSINEVISTALKKAYGEGFQDGLWRGSSER